jgi:spore maturation protein CgeB
MPSKNIYEIANNRSPSRVLLSGSFRLARAQLYYKLMLNRDINTVLFYSENRRYNKEYDGTNSAYPVNFKEKFGDKVICSSDDTYKDYIKELSSSQVTINYSRQVTSEEGFHLDIDYNMSKISQKQDFEFISTRVRECALTKTACISNYDKIYSMSGLEEGVHMITYSSYDDLVDKTKYLSANPELCQRLGENLFSYYRDNYTDTHLIKKIKEIFS